MIKYKTTKEVLPEDQGKRVKYTLTGSFLLRPQGAAQGIRSSQINHDVIFTGKELTDRAYMAAKLKAEKKVHRKHCKLVFRIPRVKTSEVVTQESCSDPVVEVDLKAHARALGSTDKGVIKK